MAPPKGHARLMATYPNASTSPGTASGSITSASRSHAPRMRARTRSRAATNPTASAKATAASERRSEFRMLPAASGCVSACS
jgi:hypothetical protein